MGSVLVVSLPLLAPTILSPAASTGFPELWLMLASESLHLLPSAAEGWFSEDD